MGWTPPHLIGIEVPDWTRFPPVNGEKKSAMKLIRVGVDLAKNVFQVHGVDRKEKALRRRRLTRENWLKVLLETVDPSREIGMESCAGAHHWARKPQEKGFRVHRGNRLAAAACKQDRGTRDPWQRGKGQERKVGAVRNHGRKQDGKQCPQRPKIRERQAFAVSRRRAAACLAPETRSRKPSSRRPPAPLRPPGCP